MRQLRELKDGLPELLGSLAVFAGVAFVVALMSPIKPPQEGHWYAPLVGGFIAWLWFLGSRSPKNGLPHEYEQRAEELDRLADIKDPDRFEENLGAADAIWRSRR